MRRFSLISVLLVSLTALAFVAAGCPSSATTTSAEGTGGGGETTTTAAAATTTTAGGGGGAAGPVTIKMTGVAAPGFDPAEVEVAVGTDVTWVNADTTGTPHNATADDGTFKSEAAMTKDAKFTFKMDKAGTFAYKCTLHPTTMIGKITVK